MTKAERAEQRERKRAEARERFSAAVDELASSEGWRRWAESRARFHRYSFHNTLLIAHQRPDATLVASYRTWQDAGRQVRRGERGIAIAVPIRVKVRSDDDRDALADQLAASRKGLAPRPGSLEDEPPEGERTVVRFKTGHVFDVSQTDGEPLPELERQPITGESHAGYLPRLEALAGELGFRVERRDLSGDPRGGWCDREGSLIVVDSTEPANGRVRVLVHELAHALGISYEDFGRETAEVIVETAAVIACGAIGLDISGESVPYVAAWADGDTAAIRDYAVKVDECARRITDALDVDDWALAEAA